MATLPKGITATTYKTKQGTVIKFQVRFQEKAFKTCKTFEKYESALNYLAECKTAYGKWKVDEKSVFAKAVVENMYLQDLRFYMNQHFQYRYGKLDLTNELQKKRFSQIKSVYRSIAETDIELNSFTGYDEMSVYTTFQKQNSKVMPLGLLKVHEVSPNVINSFIQKKLADGLKKISILTYLTIISNFFKDLKYINEAFKNIPNPTLNYDKKLLSNALKRTAKRISDNDIERLETELAKSINKDVLPIFQLSLFTAMRRSEIIFLEWEQINDFHINLFNTKTEDYRKVYLVKEAQELIQRLKNNLDGEPNGRIFKTSINAFERVFRLSVLRLGLDKKVTFHMARKTSISKMFERLGDNSTIISEIFGFRNPDKLKQSHHEGVNDETESSVMKQVGHKQRATTLRNYLTLDK